MKKIIINNILIFLIFILFINFFNIFYKNNSLNIKQNIKLNNDKIKLKNKFNNWKKVYYNEFPFNNIDNKWYFIIWRRNKYTNWKTVMFKNNIKKNRIIDKINSIILEIRYKSLGFKGNFELLIKDLKKEKKIFNNLLHNKKLIHISTISSNFEKDKDYFKGIYRYQNNDHKNNIYINLPIINSKSGEIINSF